MADTQQPSPRQAFIDAMIDLDKASAKAKQVATDYEFIKQAVTPLPGEEAINSWVPADLLRLVYQDK